jgi:hypothetical protein
MRGIAARCLAAQLSVDLGHGFEGRLASGYQFKRTIAHRSGIKRSITPPGEVAIQDVRRVETPARDQAFRQPYGQPDRSTDPVSGCQPYQHASTAVWFLI